MADDDRIDLLQTILKALESVPTWTAVAEVVSTSVSEEDAVQRLQRLLPTSEIGARALLDQPIRTLLPDQREYVRTLLVEATSQDGEPPTGP